MTEIEYQLFLKLAKSLIGSIQRFPAHELNAFAEKHHPEDKSFTSKMRTIYLEAYGED